MNILNDNDNRPELTQLLSLLPLDMTRLPSGSFIDLLHIYCHSEIQDGSRKWKFVLQTNLNKRITFMNSNGCTDICIVVEFIETIFYILWDRRSKQMTAHKRKYLYLSLFTTCSTVSTDVPMFWRISMKPCSILCDASGSRIEAAHKQGIRNRPTYDNFSFHTP